MAETRDEKYLRQAIALAKQSRASGCHPFGAVIVSADDRVLAACESRKERGGDATQHSELSAVRIASSNFPKSVLAGSTLYSSTEPCAMCAGAIYWGVASARSKWSARCLRKRRRRRMLASGAAAKPTVPRRHRTMNPRKF